MATFERTSNDSTEKILEENPQWKYIKTDRNNTRYFSDRGPCMKCNGTGRYAWFGTCFDCNGTGRRDDIVKVYTQEHRDKLDNNREQRNIKKQQERNQKLINSRPENLKKFGFGEENGEFVIYRVLGDTYPIREKLKNLGCKFNYVIGWYSSKPLSDYETQRLTEKEVLEDAPLIEWKPADEIKKLFPENEEKEDVSEYIGNIGDKIRVSAKIINSFSYETQFGTSYVYIFRDDHNNVLKWSTGTFLGDYDENKEYLVTGTVKDHTEYTDKHNKTTKQTVITRAKVF